MRNWIMVAMANAELENSGNISKNNATIPAMEISKRGKSEKSNALLNASIQTILSAEIP